MGSFRDPSPVIVAIVDDSDLVCTVIERLLSVDTSILVAHCAHTARDAREYLAANTVDVVTLDLNLPDASGPGLVEEMVSSNCPAVIAVSASPEQCRQARERGAIAAFDKLRLYEERFSFIAAIHRAADLSRALRSQSCTATSSTAAVMQRRQTKIDEGQSAPFTRNRQAGTRAPFDASRR